MGRVSLRRRAFSGFVAVTTLLTAGFAAGAAGSAPAPDEQAAKFERKFLAETIDHHFGAVKMGRICERKGEDRRLERVCPEIVDAQSEEIDTMRRWLERWYGDKKSPELDAQMKADLEELRRARRGEEFDVMVSEMFIEHHEQQVRRSKRCLQKAAHKRLVAMCKEQIEVQRAEIKLFEKVIESYA
jgi:uncharacterized protein (DUF305 family)